MGKLILDDFTGGLNLQEPTTIKENELTKAENVFYSSDYRLTSRRGIKNIFAAVPDSISVLATMNTFNGDGTWTAGGDANTVATDATNKKYLAGSTTFTITVVGTTAKIENTGITVVDLTLVKATGYFTMWVNLPVVANLTNVTLTLGNTLDAQDYELSTTTNINGGALAIGWNLLKFNWADMVATGAPTGSIAQIRVAINYGVGFAGGAGFKVDGIIWNSGTTTKSVHSMYEVKLTNGTIVTLAACNGSLFRLNNNYWYLLKTGFNSTAKVCFINYKNVIYYSNGVDDYHDYDVARESAAGILTIAYGSAPKAKYLKIVGVTAYATGIKDSLNELQYTAAAPLNLQSYANNEFIWDDKSREIITGFDALPSDAIAVFLENSAYYVDTVTSPVTIRPLDYDGGCQSFRTIQRVGNDTFFLAEDALYSLTQRQGTVGTFGSASLSDKILPFIQTGSDLSTANAFRGKRVMPNHYYLNLDTTNSGFPTSCLVYNIRLQAWTEYTNIYANQMIEHEDSDGNFHLIYANVYSGQIREFEVGFDDNGVEIQVKIWTKEIDFGDPTLFKEVNECDISGFCSETSLINVLDELDGDGNGTDAIIGSDFATTGLSFTLGVNQISTKPLTGDPIDGDIILNLFNVRKNIYQSAYRVKIKLESQALYSAFVLSKIQFNINSLPIDFFPNDSYI